MHPHQADKLWRQRSWSAGWMEPPSWAQPFIIRPLTFENQDRRGRGFDTEHRSCFVWGTDFRWVGYRWRLREGDWLLGKVPRIPTQPGSALFAMSDTERPEGPVESYTLDDFPWHRLGTVYQWKGYPQPAVVRPRAQMELPFSPVKRRA